MLEANLSAAAPYLGLTVLLVGLCAGASKVILMFADPARSHAPGTLVLAYALDAAASFAVAVAVAGLIMMTNL